MKRVYQKGIPKATIGEPLLKNERMNDRNAEDDSEQDEGAA